jgi:hypothetical protein
MAQMTESGRVPAKLGDQIGLYSAFQPVEKPISGFRNHGLHGCDGAALERFVNKAAQAAMLRIVLAEHVQRQNTDRPRQASQYALTRPASRIGRVTREIPMVLQQCRATVMGDRQPCAADNRQLHAYDRAFGPHPLKREERICVKRG